MNSQQNIAKDQRKRLTKEQIKNVIKYVFIAQELEAMKGMRDGFVFDIPKQIKYLDEKSNGGFNAKVYSPLVYEEIPSLKRGTIAYDDFWDEQDRRCLEGYAPIVDGIEYPRITGAHYFYLNMYQIMMVRMDIQRRRKELWYPYYRALDHMIFLEIEKAKKEGYGIIIGKARRMGLSYIGSALILYYLIFFPHNFTAVGAGIEEKAILLYDKIKKSIENIRPEYKFSYQTSKKKMRLIYSKSENKIKTPQGIQSELDVNTFFNNPSAFEGGSYDIFIIDEIGIFPSMNLIKSYKSSEPCFMEGGMQFGVPLLFGTGGEIEKGSKDFKIMWKNPRAYKLKKIFIPKFMYYPGEESDDEEKDPFTELEKNANFFDVRTGLTNEEKALEHIMKRRIIARKSKEGYVKEVQANPIKESDIFLKTDGGLLNRISLAAQRERIYNKENILEYEQGRYEWIDTDEIKMKLSRCRNTKEKVKVRVLNNAKVIFIPDPDGTVFKLKGIYPINNDRMPFKPDITGTDSYDDEGIVESKSMGASIVYRLFNGFSKDYDLPTCYIHERGDGTTEDTFFENNVMQSIYWDSLNLIEYTKTALITYYIDVGAEKYLKEKPIFREEVATNRGSQRYGLRMTTGEKGIKSLITTLLKLEVKDNVQNIYFEAILDDLMEYGDSNTDLAMAYGLVLAHKLELFDHITDDLEETVDTGDVLMDMVSWQHDSNGRLVLKSFDNFDDNLKLEKFDPRIHLEGEEREEYLNFMAIKIQKQNEEKEKREIAFLESQQNKQKDPFSTARLDYLDIKDLE